MSPPALSPRIMCVFCPSPASALCSEQIDLVCNKFLYHYFEIPFKLQVNPDGTFCTSTFHVCAECAYLFREIQRLSSIWVEVQVHLFNTVIPELRKKFEIKDIQQQIGAVDQNKNALIESSFSNLFREHLMKVVGTIPDAVDAKKQAERLGRFLPVHVVKEKNNSQPQPNGAHTSQPEIQIESNEWFIRHQCEDNVLQVVTLVYPSQDNQQILEISQPQQIQQTEAYVTRTVGTPLEYSYSVDFDGGNGDEDYVLQNEEEVNIDSEEDEDKMSHRNKRKSSPLKAKATSTSNTASDDMDEPKRKKKKGVGSPKKTAEPKKHIKCKFCPLVIYHAHTYRKHEQRIHKNFMNFKCLHCEEKFSSEEYLKAHEEMHRTDVSEFTCILCQKTFGRPHMIRKHVQLVHIPNYIEATSVGKSSYVSPNDKEFKCPICATKLASKKSLTKHINLHYKALVICEYCPGFQTKNHSLMVSHLYKSHPDEPKNLTCQQCGKMFSYQFILNRHVDYHKLENIKPLSCSYCELRFGEDEELAFTAHQNSCIEITVSDPKPVDVQCSQCDRKFPRGRDILLARHELTHEELVIYNCTGCDAKYTRKAFLETHLKTHSDGPYQCGVCPAFDFKTAEELSKHLKEYHTGEAVIKCTEEGCHEIFTHRSSMLYHRTKDHNRPKFGCTICKKEFNKSDSLKIHMERLHPDQCPTPPRQIQCHLCSKIFVRGTHLNQHIRTTHEKKNVTRKQCDICLKSVSKRIYKEHQNYHKGIKSFLCTVCGRSFFWYNNYKSHVDQHSGERKTYSCDKCDKTFLQLQSRKYHMNAFHKVDEDGNPVPPKRMGRTPKKKDGAPRKRKQKPGTNKKLGKRKAKLKDDDDAETTTDEENEEKFGSDSGDESEPDSDDNVSDEDKKLFDLSFSAAQKARRSHSKVSSPEESISRKSRRNIKKANTLKQETESTDGEEEDSDEDFHPTLVSCESLVGSKGEMKTSEAEGDEDILDEDKNAPTRKSARSRKPLIKD